MVEINTLSSFDTNKPRLAATAGFAIGRIVSVSGAQAVVVLDSDENGRPTGGTPSMGSLVKIISREGLVIGIVSGLSIPVPASSADEHELKILEIEMVGEIVTARDSAQNRTFRRGVSAFPTLGSEVHLAASEDLSVIFSSDATGIVRIGSIQQDENIPAHIIPDDLLAKHFAVVGTTGTGKSCAVSLILRGMMQEHKNAHIVVLDPHNEYAPAFGDQAEVIGPETLQLPYWLLNFDELVEVLLGGETGRRVEMEVLREIIPIAKQNYRAGAGEASSLVRKTPSGGGNTITVDTPVPYRISDLIQMLDTMMGKLDKPESLVPYKRLKARIEALTVDGRYAFMFGGLTVRDIMRDVIGRIFRVPVDGRPITVMDLSGVPAEILNVVVSVVCRMAFDLAMWSDRQVPITIVCEEAHRYVPRNAALGFEPTKRAISKIAKEGRKYGVSLCVVTQRPSEIDPTILSQTSTIFAMRLTNQNDQEIVQAAVSDAAVSLLEFLPSMGNGEAIAIGEGVPLPMRIRFDRLPDGFAPRSSGASFSEGWKEDRGSAEFVDAVIDRWRGQRD
jgi:DNA helicase HerA-like ATPase